MRKRRGPRADTWRTCEDYAQTNALSNTALTNPVYGNLEQFEILGFTPPAITASPYDNPNISECQVKRVVGSIDVCPIINVGSLGSTQFFLQVAVMIYKAQWNPGTPAAPAGFWDFLNPFTGQGENQDLILWQRTHLYVLTSNSGQPYSAYPYPSEKPAFNVRIGGTRLREGESLQLTVGILSSVPPPSGTSVGIAYVPNLRTLFGRVS